MASTHHGLERFIAQYKTTIVFRWNRDPLMRYKTKIVRIMVVSIMDSHLAYYKWYIFGLIENLYEKFRLIRILNSKAKSKRIPLCKEISDNVVEIGHTFANGTLLFPSSLAVNTETKPMPGKSAISSEIEVDACCPVVIPPKMRDVGAASPENAGRARCGWAGAAVVGAPIKRWTPL